MPVPGTGFVKGFGKYLGGFFKSPLERNNLALAKTLEGIGQGGAASALRAQVGAAKVARLTNQIPGSVSARRWAAGGLLGAYGVGKYLGDPIVPKNTMHAQLYKDPVTGTVRSMGMPFAGKDAYKMYASNFIPIGSKNPSQRGALDQWLEAKNKVPGIDEAMAASGRPIFISHAQDKVWRDQFDSLNPRNQAYVNSQRVKAMQEGLGLSKDQAMSNLPTQIFRQY